MRRLLENGANSSFVNRIADPAVPVAELVADPIRLAAARCRSARRIRASCRRRAVRGRARQLAGLDLASEELIARLGEWLAEPAGALEAEPMLGGAGDCARRGATAGPGRPSVRVGRCRDADAADVAPPLGVAVAAAARWSAAPDAERAASWTTPAT